MLQCQTQILSFSTSNFKDLLASQEWVVLQAWVVRLGFNQVTCPKVPLCINNLDTANQACLLFNLVVNSLHTLFRHRVNHLEMTKASSLQQPVEEAEMSMTSRQESMHSTKCDRILQFQFLPF
jgi:hypothetical protein